MFKKWIIALVVCSLFPLLSTSAVQAQSWQERLMERFRADQQRDEQRKKDKQMEQWQNEQRRDREAALDRENKGKRQYDEERNRQQEGTGDSSASASNNPANWAGKWTVKQTVNNKSGNEMTFDLKQDNGGGFKGTWSSDIGRGEITISAYGEGRMTHSLLGKCRIKLNMANTQNTFFKGDYSCTDHYHDPVYVSVKGIKKKSWW